MKQRMRGAAVVNEASFEKLVQDLDESISGSDSSSSEEEATGKDTTLSALLKKQARLHGDGANDEDFFGSTKKRKRGQGTPPLIWFSSSTLPTNTSLGIYRALLSDAERQDHEIVQLLRAKQLKPTAPPRTASGIGVPVMPSGPKVFLCMIGGGHFAAMIVSLTPKLIKNSKGFEERQAMTIAHKTFHRYTTRRKQGGSQSANDMAKGNAHSAGAGIRRANEVALEHDIRSLLSEWRQLIEDCQLLFIRATGTTNRRTLFEKYESQVLRSNDPRLRSFPFSTRRATQSELMRAFVELTRIKVSQVDEAALAAAEAAEAAEADRQSKLAMPTPKAKITLTVSKEEEEATLHTSQLQALVRRSKVPAVLSYLSNNSVPPDFVFHPPTAQSNHHASTPLHLAASSNSAVLVSALLIKAGANPAVGNGDGRPPFDIAGDRSTRDAFRVARFELGEDKWDWNSAHVPSPMTKAEADQREKTERDQAQRAEQAESERRKAEIEKLAKDMPQEDPAKASVGRMPLRGVEMTAQDRREQEGRGLNQEMRMKIERERRARAAEERMKRLAGR